MLWCSTALTDAGIATPLPYSQNQMWFQAAGNGNEWFLTSGHELAYLTLREAASNFIEEHENQDTLRHTAHPVGAWEWQPPGGPAGDVFEGDIPNLDLAADEAALEEDIMYQLQEPWLDRV
jgi:hypothetical protein